MSRSANPFHQAETHHVLTLVLPREWVDTVDEAYADVALSTSSFEVEETPTLWRMEIIAGDVGEAELLRRFNALPPQAIKGVTPDIKILKHKDWVSEVVRSFPPLNVARFFVHGSHHEGPKPVGCIPLHVDAGAAFGSGEHATTSGCLIALDALARKRRFTRMLDMGCGSGILAIAMAKCWKGKVTAIDVDRVSVRVTDENFHINRVQHYAKADMQNGYAGKRTGRGKTFDLICANILARPLARMAPQLARCLAPGGIAVLSGLLASQERQVLAAHRRHGLRLIARIPKDGWHTLVIGK